MSASAFSKRSRVACALGLVGQQVVVVEGHRCRAELGELVGRLDRVEQRAGGRPEDVDPLPADGPQTEGELVVGGGGVVVHAGISCQESVSELVSTAARTRCTCSPSAKDGARVATGGDVVHQVDDLVGEAVLVADEVTRWPPGADVRVLGLGHEDPPEAGGRGGLGAVEEVQQVHVLEVERQAARASR